MTVNDVLSSLDELTPNAYTTEQKLRWLRALEGQLHSQIVTAHRGLEDVPAPSAMTPDTALLAGDDYGELYVLYLQAQMARADGEAGRYNDAAAGYHAALVNWSNALRRAYLPRAAAESWRVL